MRPMGLLPERNVIPLRRRARHARHTKWGPAVARLEARVAELERHMAAFDRRIAVLGRHARIQVAVALSVLLHAIIILGVRFTLPDASRLDAPQMLEVTLVNTKSTVRPLKADAFAQANLDGGGNTDANRRARSPLPVPHETTQATDVTMAQKRVELLERDVQQLMTQQRSRTTVEVVPDEPRPPTEAQAGLNAADIMSRSLEIARLEATIDKRLEAYQQRPRRKFLGARVEEFRFARYIEDWRAKVERIGEMNYPQAARDDKKYGSLVVTVAIKADGSLEDVEIRRSSGVRILDQAAIRIVRLAAPYAPFPSEIAKDTDVLSITRTWMFTRSDQFVSE
jgi:periplasmic protein TonB